MVGCDDTQSRALHRYFMYLVKGSVVTGGDTGVADPERVLKAMVTQGALVAHDRNVVLFPIYRAGVEQDDAQIRACQSANFRGQRVKFRSFGSGCSRVPAEKIRDRSVLWRGDCGDYLLRMSGVVSAVVPALAMKCQSGQAFGFPMSVPSMYCLRHNHDPAICRALLARDEVKKQAMSLPWN